jgi:3-phenylpropionate/trans-cinnamate dioxygenase ferredoxin subunit
VPLNPIKKGLRRCPVAPEQDLQIKFLFIREPPETKLPDDTAQSSEGADTDAFIQVATVNDLADGSMKKIRAGGKDLLLARVRDRYYCTDAYCPHLGGNLSEGTLTGTILTCPLHHSQFDISDGHVLRWTDLTGGILLAAKTQRPPRPLRTYPVKIEGNAVFVTG